MLQAGGTEVAGVMQITPEMGQFRLTGASTSGWKARTTPWRRLSRWARPYSCLPPTSYLWEGQPAIGRFASLADPQGAAFGIFQPICETPRQ